MGEETAGMYKVRHARHTHGSILSEDDSSSSSSSSNNSSNEDAKTEAPTATVTELEYKYVS